MWITLGEVISVSSGKNLTQKQMKDTGKYPVYGGNGITGYFDEYLVDKDTIVIGRVGYYCGSALKVISKSWVTDNALIVRYSENIFYIDFLLCLLNQLNLKQSTVSTAQPVISGQRIYPIIFPLPPLNEQKRIVAKLEEVLPFIDEYNKKEQRLTVLHQQFPEQLKKSILQSALQGKLVEQDPNDEPASELIKRIQAEKARLILAKKIKKPKVKSEIIVRDNLPYEIVNGVERCIADEVPFEIPENWCWVRLGDIGILTAGKTPSNNDLLKKGNIPYFKVSDMNTIGNEFYLRNTELFLLNSKISYPKDSIVFPKNGGALLTNKKRILSQESLVDLNTGIFISTRYIDINFLYFLFVSIDFKKIYKGTALPTLDYEKLNNLLIGIPPFNEQKRIVQKIEELFSYIEYL